LRSFSSSWTLARCQPYKPLIKGVKVRIPVVSDVL
jgi:hypothetical protein